VTSENPLIGVVVPVRDAGRWLDGMLTSLEAQTYTHWRAVVVDDGSTDDSREIARRHQRDDARILAVSGPGTGQGAPLTRAHGRSVVHDAAFLYFPDADDLLAPDLLSTLLARLQSDPDAVAAFCRYTRIDDDEQPIREPPPQRLALSRHWVRCLPDEEAATPFESIYGWAAPAMEPVILFRASAFDEAGGWEAWPRQGGESIDLLCRMIARGGRVLFEPRPLYRYRRHESQHTRDAHRYTFAAPRETREVWQERAEVDSSLRALVTRAEFFVAHRLIPRNGLYGALRHAKEGNLLPATRFMVGALLRYRWRAPR
jgi:glycosyltransferase involved in cell wall biosynthesis